MLHGKEASHRVTAPTPTISVGDSEAENSSHSAQSFHAIDHKPHETAHPRQGTVRMNRRAGTRVSGGGKRLKSVYRVLVFFRGGRSAEGDMEENIIL